MQLKSDGTHPSRSRRVVVATGSWLIVGLISLALAEVSLRLAFPIRLGALGPPIPTGEESLVRWDAQLGWSFKPGVHEVYTTQLFKGDVHIDARGLRQNAATSTFVDGAHTVFMIGDSTTANLEVDDEETVSARLEQQLRASGAAINVVNLGVRGYGTDQAVLQALRLRDLRPRYILYTFTSNDLADNNTLQRLDRGFGKGVFIRPAGERRFSPHNYPVPSYAPGYFGQVGFGQQCEPSVREGMITVETPRVASGIPPWVKNYFWTFRALSSLRWKQPPDWLEQRIPAAMLRAGTYDAASGEEFTPEVFQGYKMFFEKGPLRNRCSEYLEAQMADLLGRLRQIPGIAGVFVVHFPDLQVQRDLEAGRSLPLPTVDMFRRLREAGVIDEYLNLGQRLMAAGIKYEDFMCPGDMWHFCEAGTAWISGEIGRAFGARLTTD